MKKIFAIIAGSIIVSGCSDPEVDYRQVIDHRGMIFDAKSEEPFTGLVKRFPLKVIGGLKVATCNASFKEGLKHGKTECFVKSTKILSAEYIEGKLNGVQSMWDVNTGHQTTKTEYKNDIKNGLEEGFYNASGEPEFIKEWDNGRQDGEEKRWNESGELISELNWSSGKYSGYKWRLKEIFKEGSSASCKEVYSDSKLHGTVKCYRNQGQASQVSTNEDGLIYSIADYTNGKIDGSHKIWAQDQSIILQEKVDDGLIIQRDYQLKNNDKLVSEEHWLIEDVDGARKALNKSEFMIHTGSQLKTNDSGGVVISAKWKDGALLHGVVNDYLGYSGNTLIGTLSYKGNQDGLIVKDGLEERFQQNGKKLYQIKWENGSAKELIVFYQYGKNVNIKHSEPKAKDWSCTYNCDELTRYVSSSLEQPKVDRFSSSPFEITYQSKIY